MKNQFVPYELALKLKELGFDRRCFADYFEFIGLNKSSEKNIRVITCEEELLDYQIANKVDSSCIGSAPLWQQAFDWFREKGFDNGVSLDEDKTYSFEIWNPKTKRGYYDCAYINYRKARQDCLEKLIELATDRK